MKKIAIAATSDRSGRLDVLGVGSDNQMYYKSSNVTWSAWQPAGGALTSHPAIVDHRVLLPDDAHYFDVFTVGVDNQIYRNHYGGLVRSPGSGPTGPIAPVASSGAGAAARPGIEVGAWSGWQALGGVLASPPAVVSWGAQRTDTFYIGADRQMWHNWWEGDKSGYDALGGIFTCPPAAVSWGANRLDVFGLGLDNQMYHKAWGSTGWYPSAIGWENLGGPAPVGGPNSGGFNTQPAVVCWGANRIDVFALSNENRMLHKAFNGSWQDWEDLGGQFTSVPAAVSWAPGRLDIFAVGADNQMYHNWFEAGWGGWESLGGAFISAPTAVSWGKGRLDVFALGTDNAMYHNWYEGGWGGWESFGGSFEIPRPNCAQVDFVLGGFYLHNRRSNAPAGGKDTVKISMSLTVDDQVYPAQYCDYGSIGDTNRWYGIRPGGAGSMGFPAVVVKRDSVVKLAFLMVNSGHPDEGKIQDDLNKGADYLAALATASVGATGPWGAIVAGGLEGLKYLIDLFTANCDGPLAADAVQLSGGDLIDNDWVASRGYVGGDSPKGCGSNSNYHVVIFTRPRGSWGLQAFLEPGQRIPIGGHLVSRSGDISLEMQADGNLVVYYARAAGVSMAALWASNTSGHKVDRCEMQTDGNFVLYEGATPVFSTKTNGRPGAYAAIQDDGNFVVYSADHGPLYPSNTNYFVDSA